MKLAQKFLILGGLGSAVLAGWVGNDIAEQARDKAACDKREWSCSGNFLRVMSDHRHRLIDEEEGRILALIAAREPSDVTLNHCDRSVTYGMAQIAGQYRLNNEFHNQSFFSADNPVTADTVAAQIENVARNGGKGFVCAARQEHPAYFATPRLDLTAAYLNILLSMQP